MKKNAGIYIHIPFCVRKCNYCAFLSYPASNELREQYVEALAKECKEYFTLSNSIRKANFTSVDTIYFGGGTPSVLTVEQIKRILDAVRDAFDISHDAEITIEANPGTLGENEEAISAKLEAYREMGINRLSMGVQSMNNDRLKYLGRIHSAEDVRRDFELARSAGFDNINLDLILSVPDGSFPIDAAMEDVKSIVDLEPEHISCYSLQLEEGTKFFEMFENGELAEVPDELDREVYHKVCDYLVSRGYVHYEISNFAKSGFRSKHNSKYWDMTEYIGIGLGASGFVNGSRYRNTTEMADFLDGKYVQEETINSEHDNISEAVFLGLRRKEGINYEEICKEYFTSQDTECKGNFTYRDTFWDYYKDEFNEAKQFADGGFLIIDDEGMRLTEKGIDISNKIMALFV